jgi:hypothetical protein
MSATSPPTYYFPNIGFNSSYYSNADEDALTQSNADVRYLIKVKPDTTNNLQTFSAGIDTQNSNVSVGNGSVTALAMITTSLLSTADAGGLDIAPTQSSGSLGIGNLETRTGNINIATGKNTPSAQEIVLGSSSALATGQFIRINRPIKLNYLASYELQYTFTKLGGYSSNSSGELLAINSATASTTLTNFSNIPAGEYMFHYQISYRNTTATSTFSRQHFVLSTTLNDFTNIIDDNVTLYLSNTTAIAISSPLTDYTHRFCNSGSIVLSSQSDVYLNYRTVWTGTGIPYIKGFLKLIRIG